MKLHRKNVGNAVILFGYESLMFLVPTLAEIHLKLSETEVQHGNLSGSVSMLTEGLAIENRSKLRILSLSDHFNYIKY